MSDLEALVERVLTDKVTHEVVVAAEGTELAGELWAELAGLGLPGIGVDEAAGGSGGSLEDLLVLLHASGRYAVPLPLLEHHLALWLVAAAGGRVPDGRPWTVAPPQHGLSLDGDRASGTLLDVAWGASASRVVSLVGTDVVVVDPATATATAGRDLAGQPRDRLVLEGAPVEVLPGRADAEQLARRGAALRAVQMAGAMQGVYDLTDSYVYQREQFGRPVGTFQAVRRHLVLLAEAAVMTRVSAERAAAAVEAGQGAGFAAYSAKLVADQSAAISIKSGHQAHGAIGMTREYPLQDLTRRLNAWRGEWGGERELAERIGRGALDVRRISALATDREVLQP